MGIRRTEINGYATTSNLIVPSPKGGKERVVIAAVTREKEKATAQHPLQFRLLLPELPPLRMNELLFALSMNEVSLSLKKALIMRMESRFIQISHKKKLKKM